MKNWTIRTKLLTGFILVAILTCVVGVIGIVSSQRLDKQTTEIASYVNANSSLGDMREANKEIRMDLRTIALYWNDKAKQETYCEDLASSEEAVSAAIKEYEVDAFAPDVEKNFYNFKNLYENEFVPFIAQFVDMAKSFKGVDASEQTELINFIAGFGDKVSEIESSLQSSVEDNLLWADGANKDATSLADTVFVTQIIVTALSVLLAVGLAFLIVHQVVPPIQKITAWLGQVGQTGSMKFDESEIRWAKQYAEQKDETGQIMGAFVAMMNKMREYGGNLETIAEQDLSEEIVTLGKDDTMGGALTKMSENLNETFGQIKSSTGEVDHASRQIAEGAQALAQGSTQQAAAVEELFASINAIAAQTKESASLANKAAGLAGSARAAAETGSEQMANMVTAVQEINAASSDIEKVIKVIDDIAFQTNILALNAAVEAARAGQHGKGFAVVAEEVRNLAAKSAEAAKNTGVLIGTSMEKAHYGSEIAKETATSLNEILAACGENAQLVGEIASTAETQSEAIDQIEQGIQQVAEVVQSNSASSEELAATSEELASQSSQLDALVAQFRLQGEQKRITMPTARPRPVARPQSVARPAARPQPAQKRQVAYDHGVPVIEENTEGMIAHQSGSAVSVGAGHSDFGKY